jgi:hypothetical protein
MAMVFPIYRGDRISVGEADAHAHRLIMLTLLPDTTKKFSSAHGYGCIDPSGMIAP